MYQASNFFSNVPVGTDHYIEVRHTNGCIQNTELFDIVGYEPIILILTEGELNEFIANAFGGSEEYTFTMNGEDYGNDYSYIITESGVYTETVADSFGCTEYDTHLTFDIFDRYGRKEASYRVGEVWDGRYNGNELPTSDY